LRKGPQCGRWNQDGGGARPDQAAEGDAARKRGYERFHPLHERAAGAPEHLQAGLSAATPDARDGLPSPSREKKRRRFVPPRSCKRSRGSGALLRLPLQERDVRATALAE
jgi:hypothetical protein